MHVSQAQHGGLLRARKEYTGTVIAVGGVYIMNLLQGSLC